MVSPSESLIKGRDSSEFRFDSAKYKHLLPDLDKKATSIDVFFMNGVFCVVSKSRRSELTEKADNKKVEFDTHITRKWETSDGSTVVIQGPLLGLDDAFLVGTLISLYFEKNGTRGEYYCNYTDIGRKLGYRIPLGGKPKKNIQKSLSRLDECKIKIYDRKGYLFWNNSIIVDLEPEGKGKGFKLKISLNSKIATYIEKQQFSRAEFKKMKYLTGEWDKAFYFLLESSKSDMVETTIDDVYEIFRERGTNAKNDDSSLPIEFDQSAYRRLPSRKRYTVWDDMSRNILKMKDKALISTESYIAKNGDIKLVRSAPLP